MNIFPDCIPCHFNQMCRIIKSIDISDEQAFILYKRVADEFSRIPNDMKPVEMADILYRLIEEEHKISDVFFKEKKEANDMALKITERIENDINGKNMSLKTCAKLSALGNQIDLGAHDVDLDKFEKEILSRAKVLEFELDRFEEFETRLAKAKKVLFILDNAGEVVFDKLFMKKIGEQYPECELYCAVRGRAILNDVTIKEAAYVGLEEVSTVLDSGSVYPGIVMGKTTQAFAQLFEEADIIVSKGQGNFEGLSENGSEKLFFCLMIKCDTISKYTGIKKGSTVFSNRIKTN